MSRANKEDATSCLFLIFIPLLLFGVVLLNRYEESTEPTVSETHQAIVLDKETQVTSNVWTGVRGCCSIRLQLESGKIMTISPGDWEDCLKVSRGDQISIYREQYKLDMKGHWKKWEVR